MFLIVKAPCIDSKREEETGVSQREQGRGQGERSPSPPPFPSFALAPTIRVAISTLLMQSSSSVVKSKMAATTCTIQT